MKGLKTILGLLIAAYLVPWATRHGLPLTAQDQVEIIAGLGIALRFFTTGPALASVSDLLKRFRGVRTVQLPPEVITAIATVTAKATVAEFAAQQARARAARESDPNPTQPVHPATSSNGVTS